MDLVPVTTLSQLMNAGAPSQLATIIDMNFLSADSEAEMRAINAPAENGIVIVTPITLTSNMTLGVPLKIMKGGRLITNGYTLTINQAFEAGAYQCFTTSGSQVVFGTSATFYVLLEWFGATGDGTINDTSAIQVAVNRAAAALIPIIPMPNKTYRVSSITLPRNAEIIGMSRNRRPGAKFKSTGSGIMFDVDNVNDHMGSLEGIELDGNSTASALIATNIDTQTFVVRNCGFINATTAIDLSEGSVWFTAENCEFTGTYTQIVKLSTISNATTFRDCHFSGIATYCVLGDSSWIGDQLVLDACTFSTTGTTSFIKLLKSSSWTPGKTATITKCRFDGGATSAAHIDLGQYVWGVNVENCMMSDASPYNIRVAGGYVNIRDNWMADATTKGITLTATSNNVVIDGNELNNVTGGAANFYEDLSTYDGAPSTNRIVRKVKRGTTAERPTLLPTEFGATYLDNTIDADGALIAWTGTAWVRDGAIV